MKLARRIVLAVLALFFCASMTALAQEEAKRVTVYKTPGCPCCVKWMDRLRAAGFQVEAIDAKDLDAQRERLGVPPKLAACHTATIAGYTIEGHVPVEQIRQLLKQRPDVAGLSVPGNPIGAPGMEGPGGKDYEVLAFDRKGNSKLFATVKPLDH